MEQRDTIKVSIAGFLLLLTIACAVALLFYATIVGQIKASELSKFEQQSEFGLAQLESEIYDARLRTRFLANLPPIRGIMRARANGGIDPVDHSTEAQWRQRLILTFRNLAEVNSNLLQVRYIGVESNGREIVRVERVDGRIITAGENDLQEKGNRPYFRRTVQLPAGAIYQGDVEINAEAGIVEYPPKPVLRMATPVYDDSGKVFGIVVINVDATHLFDTLKNAAPQTAMVYVANRAGVFLVHPDPAKTFRSGSTDGYRFADEFPDDPQQALQRNGTDHAGVVRNRSGEPLLFYARGVRLGPFDSGSLNTVALTMPVEILTADARQVRGHVLAALVLFCLLAAGLVHFASQRLAHPMQELTGAVLEILEGTSLRDIRWPTDAADEVTRLKQAFIRVISALQKRERIIEEKNRRLKTVMDGVIDAVILIDEQGRIETCNRATSKIFGYREEELIGQNVAMLMPAYHARRHNSYIENYLRTGQAKIIGKKRELSALRKNGETFAMELGVAEAVSDGETKFIGIITDISDRYRIDRMKREFVSTVSHELRTPLSAIMGALSLLQSELPEALGGRVPRMLDIAQSNCTRLIGLINDILDMEKIESGRMNFAFEQVDLNDIVRTSVEACRSIADTCGVAMEMKLSEEPALVRGDPDRLNQVATNLLSNALKFSPEGTNVIVSVDLIEGRWRVSVQDEGPGIPEEFQPLIFTKFSQADNTSARKVGGSGLGLSISRAIMEAHDGRIGFRTSPQGTTFHFDLRAWEPEVAKATASMPVAVSRALVCEDDGETAQLIRLLVEQAGFAVTTCACAEEACHLLGREPFDLVTLDWRLAEGSGADVLACIQTSEHNRSTPVIVISALDSVETGQDIPMAMSVVHWMQKPLDIRRLRTILGSVRWREGGDIPRVLHVEDESDHRDLIRRLLEDAAEVDGVASVAEATALLDARHYDLVILDLLLPDVYGAALVDQIYKMPTPPEVMVYSVDSPPAHISHQVSAALIKTRVTQDALLDKIQSLLTSARKMRADPDQSGKPTA